MYLRLLQLGETRPSSFGPATYQDFKEIRSRCLSDGRLFEDPEFPAVDRSLYYKESLDRPITWLRPGVSVLNNVKLEPFCLGPPQSNRGGFKKKIVFI